MRIPARRLVKNIALTVYAPLRPILNAAGVDAKGIYEFAYWRSRQFEEGVLKNDWYVKIFTEYAGIERSFYDGKRILDIGCGPRGSLEWADTAAEKVGLDPLVSRYRSLGIERHMMHYVDAPAESIPYPDGHFDVVTSINSLDHVDDVDAAIQEMVRVLAPGGLILLVVEIHPKPTIAEPHSLPWDLTSRFGPRMKATEEHHLEKPRGGRNTLGEVLEARIPFDHGSGIERSGVLLAKMAKASAT